jgi:hypothetical protein
MPRPCSVCRNSRIGDISADIVNGITDKEISRRYSVSKSSVQRHRQHLGSPNSAAVAERKSAAFTALAALPSADEVGQAYSSIATRIDAIAAKAEEEGSLAVALMGLKELRSTVTAQAHLAGHVGSGQPVQVNTQVNVDIGAAVKELIAAIQSKPAHAAIRPEVDRPVVGGASLDVARNVTAETLKRLEAVIDGE